METGLRIGAAALLLMISSVLVAAEFALVRARHSRLESLRRRGSRRAGAALRLQDDLTSTLATLQVGITLANLGIGWLGEPAVAGLLERLFGLAAEGPYVRPLAFATGFIAITGVTVLLGELVPKAFAIHRAETTLLLLAGPVRGLRLPLYPMVVATHAAAVGVLRLLRLPATLGDDAGHSEEELKVILGRSHDRGQISRVGRDLLERVLGFSRLTARQIMVPRPDVVWLSSTRSLAENLEIARQSGYTRFPYCEGALDRLLGIVHVRDLVGAGPNLASVMRPALVVPETATADRLLRLFQRKRMHLAVVVDEYGGTSGVVTLEDVLEEIVGEVQDEFDQEVPAIVSSGEDLYEVAGSARLEDAARRFGAEGEIAQAEVDTVAGYVQHRLGRLARLGDSVGLGQYRLRVEAVEGNRIVRLSAARAASPSPSSRGDASGSS